MPESTCSHGIAITDPDAKACWFYGNPEHLKATGPGRKPSSSGQTWRPAEDALRQVTRFEVIDYREQGVLALPGGGPVTGVKGRVLVTGATYGGPDAHVELSLEDDGQTLKVFLT